MVIWNATYVAERYLGAERLSPALRSKSYKGTLVGVLAAAFIQRRRELESTARGSSEITVGQMRRSQTNVLDVVYIIASTPPADLTSLTHLTTRLADRHRIDIISPQISAELM